VLLNTKSDKVVNDKNFEKNQNQNEFENESGVKKVRKIVL